LVFGLSSEVNPIALFGQTFQVFNWSGVTPSGQFNIVNSLPASCVLDISQVYSTGNVGVFGHALPSTATILAGTASVSTTVSMAWRTAAANPQTGVPESLVSGVVDLSGSGVVDGQTKDGSVHTDTFVLQISYDPQAVTARIRLGELAAAQAGLIQMDYFDLGPGALDGAAGDPWKPAVLGNFGSDDNHFAGVGAWDGDLTLGDWGVNFESHAVWAVLDHNSEFAATPESGTLVLLGAAAICLAGYRCWQQGRSGMPTRPR
jgi:hypothetical protein